MSQANWKFLGTKATHRNAFKKIFTDLLLRGKVSAPRGLKILEIENYSFDLPPYVRFQSFDCRKMNLNYTKDEFLWYLRGDRFDLSILEKAKLWSSIVNGDGSLNSNYGQYLFGQGNQFDRVIELLSSDKDSRRASMMILSRDHVLSETNDLPCTYGMNFRIRDGKLNMTVQMRSQDAIFGMASDIPTFSFIHEMLLCALRKRYPDLQYGNYFHFVNSFHVYERHFGMLEALTGGKIGQPVPKLKPDGYTLIRCPQISGPDEVDFLRKLDFSSVPDGFEFVKWLLSRH